MNVVFVLKNRLRTYIFPLRDVLHLLTQKLPDGPLRFLDVGCGSGWFLKTVLRHRPGSSGLGIEVDPRYFSPSLHTGSSVQIVPPSHLRPHMVFDCVMFNDVPHHVADKRHFLEQYLTHLTPGGFLFVKDMSAENALCARWNRLHDRILSGDRICETSPLEIGRMLAWEGRGYELLHASGRRIFLYDHFWCLYQKGSTPMPDGHSDNLTASPPCRA